MSKVSPKPLLLLAWLTATACSIHVFESLIMRLLPVPFIRLGLSNVIVMYLILEKKPLEAIIVNLAKSVVGGVVTFTLLTPATLLSLGGGFAAILAMWAVHKAQLGFSPFGISICGAIVHNLTQLATIKLVVLPTANVFVLTPILLILGLLSGVLTAWIFLLVRTKYEHLEKNKDELQR